MMAPLFEHCRIQLRRPEAGGPVEFQTEDHDLTIIALGIQSKREISRTPIRVLTRMAALGPRYRTDFLGGRPPYG